MLFPDIMNGADMTDSTMVAMTSADYSGPVSTVGPSSGNKPGGEPAAMECES